MKLKLHAAWSQRLKLWTEGDKLWAEGNTLWAQAILDAYGNATLSWTWHTDHGKCTLENGERYDEDQSQAVDAA